MDIDENKLADIMKTANDEIEKRYSEGKSKEAIVSSIVEHMKEVLKDDSGKN